MSDIPFYLKSYDPDILRSLTVTDIDVEKGIFKYNILFYDPTDDDFDHKSDETGLVLKKASGMGTFRYSPGLSEEEAQTEDDLYPEVEWISFGELAVSDEIRAGVFEEIDMKVSAECTKESEGERE